jgi:hypothetical protein
MKQKRVLMSPNNIGGVRFFFAVAYIEWPSPNPFNLRGRLCSGPGSRYFSCLRLPHGASRRMRRSLPALSRTPTVLSKAPRNACRAIPSQLERRGSSA